MSATSKAAELSPTLRKRIRRLKRTGCLLDIASAVTPARARAHPGGRVGALLLWGIGDAVLSVPLLRGLKTAWPDCSVEVIGRPFLADLFRGESMVDRVHSLVAPWAAYEHKYTIWDRSWRDFAGQVRALRKVKFDWLVSVRMDPRDNLLMRVLRAKARFGLSAGGGRHWLTQRWDITAHDYHQMYRGEEAAQACHLLTGGMPPVEPSFDRNRDNADAARHRLRAAGWRRERILVVSFGAGRRLRSWDAAKINAALKQAKAHIKFLVLVDDGSEICRQIEIPPGVPWHNWRSDLYELKGLLSVADVIFCADSGVMHMAAAEGCKVVSIFGPTSPPTFGVRGAQHRILAVDPMPCRPCFDICVYPSPLCLDNLSTVKVHDALAAAFADQNGVIDAYGNEKEIQPD
jgi:ADP-heptose:LPS heptosyltransferase